MLEQAKAAEAAGFDGLGVSDHFAPWFPDGRGSMAWVHLAAAGQVTTKPLGTGVTPIVHHYHPGVVAQAFMSLEDLYPGRMWLGVGSGESLNETPLGMQWPEPGEMLERFEAGIDAIDRLFNGETVTVDAGWFKLREAKLYTRAASRPKLYMSAFGPQAAAIAGKYGDGLWTLGDPEAVPEILEAYRKACGDSGKGEGEIILQSGIAWGESDEAALEGARRWKPTQMPEVYRDDIHDPAEMQRLARRANPRDGGSGGHGDLPAVDRPGRPAGHDQDLRGPGAARAPRRLASPCYDALALRACFTRAFLSRWSLRSRTTPGVTSTHSSSRRNSRA